MSHVTHIYEPCHTCEHVTWAMPHVWTRHMSHATRVNTSHIYMSHATRVNTSHKVTSHKVTSTRALYQMSHITYTNKFCRTCEGVKRVLWYRVAKIHRMPYVAGLFRKRATNCRALLWKMTCTYRASYEAWPPWAKRSIKWMHHVIYAWLYCITYCITYVTCECVISHMNESRRKWMGHISYECGSHQWYEYEPLHMSELCYWVMSHECILAHANELRRCPVTSCSCDMTQ